MKLVGCSQRSSNDAPVDLTPFLRRDEVMRQLERWIAPVVDESVIEAAAKIYLQKPGHELMPFFLWFDAWTRMERH